MEVVLDKTYPVAAGLEASWAILSNMHELATCMPGAQMGRSQTLNGQAVVEVQVEACKSQTLSRRSIGKRAHRGLQRRR